MTTRRAFGGAALVVAVVLAVLVAVAALSRTPQSAVHLAGGPVAVQSTLSPAEPQFGDPVAATIEVLVDRRRVDPGSVQVGARFAPFAVISSTRSVSRSGRLSIVRIRDRLDCLDPACLPKDGAATFRFPRLRITFRGGSLVVPWPAVRVHARVTAADLARPILRVGPPVAHPSYRLPPHATGLLLLAIALAAALGGLTLVARAALSWLAFGTRRRGSALERLLDELARGSSNGSGSRRALERLARELEPLDERLSFESRVLAWAPQEPEPVAISDLARRVRAAVDV
jgi:hypothetical protein